MSGEGSRLRCRPISEEDARAIATWRYPAPYDAYDADPEDPGAVAHLLRPDYAYHALLTNEGELVGYFCLGPDARIVGGVYDDSAVDLGMGLRPDLTGRGRGSDFLAAILEFAAARAWTSRVRATIAAWNKRALRLCEKTGFRMAGGFGGFRRAGGGHYVVLVAELRAAAPREEPAR